MTELIELEEDAWEVDEVDLFAIVLTGHWENSI
jgi:hypothetical protein